MEEMKFKRFKWLKREILELVWALFVEKQN